MVRAAALDTPAPPSFLEALRGPAIRVIAEVKRSSPSKGSIAPGLDAVTQAQAYVMGGAAAISVLTEPARFSGSLTDLEEVSASVSVPVLRKDFLVHPVQLWEARAAGAAAALLIARALSLSVLPALVETAFNAGIEPLVEVRDLDELARAIDAGARVIGVNNRNLETLEIDPTTAPAVIAHIPSDRVAIAESGIRTADDVVSARDAGADAILVGSAISSASDPASSVKSLASVMRSTTARVSDGI